MEEEKREDNDETREPSTEDIIKEVEEEIKKEPEETKLIEAELKEEPKKEYNKAKEQIKEKPKTVKIEHAKKPEPIKKEPFNIKNSYNSLSKWFVNFYDKQYKKLMVIPTIILILSFISIGYQIKTTGDFINKDVTLKGGITITIPLEKDVDIAELQNYLSSQFAGNDISVRSLKKAGAEIGITVTADIATEQENINLFLSSIKNKLNIELEEGSYSVEVMGSTLGVDFFKNALRSLLLAFLFMAIVVFAVFRVPIPSLAVILAAFSDIVVTVAVVNLLGIKLGTAGIAAFLMLIGYSVDTDILLTTRVLKRKEGTEFERILSSVSTGMTMTLTAITAVAVAIIFTQNDTIRQIMTILLIGLLADIINTWIQNVGILRFYLERKSRQTGKWH